MEARDDVMLMAKQFMLFAHLRCPKPPIRYARGLLQSTIRMENTYYLGMDAVNVYAGSEQAYYMPYTNEKWVSPKWKGAINPNMYWWDKSIQDIANYDLKANGGVMING